MGLINDTSRYTYDNVVSGDDYLIGSDADDLDITKSFKVDDLITYISTQISGTSSDNIFQEVDLGSMNEGDSISALANALPAYTITETGLALYTVNINPTTAEGLAREEKYITLLKGKGTYGVAGTALLDADFYNINPVQLETVRNSLIVENLLGVNQILSGNVVYSGTGLVFESTAYSYVIGGVIYNAVADDSITLSVGGASPRIDIIVADTSGNITVIAGTPATSPVKPSLSDFDTQIELTSVNVAISATTPTGISDEDMYLEFAGEPNEWTVTESTSSARISLNSALDPYAGSVSIRIAAPIDADYVLFTNDASLGMDDYTHLAFRIKLDSVLPNGFGFNITPTDSAVQSVGSIAVQHEAYGLDGTNITDHQLIAIPISAFSDSVDFDAIQFTIFGADASETIYIDNVRLIAGMDVISELVALTIIDEGNGNGYILTDSIRSDHGNIGLHAVDFSKNTSGASTTHGAGGTYSFASGSDVSIIGGDSAWGATNFGSTNVIGSGTNNVVGASAIGTFITLSQGYAAVGLGCYHTIAMEANGFGLTGGMGNYLNDIGTSAIGIALKASARGQHVVGHSNIEWAGSSTAADRPLFTVGNGTYTTPAGQWLQNTPSDAFNVFADGSIDAPLLGDGTFTGTATYLLGLDTDGNFIEEPLPTLQNVTDVGATTTNSITMTTGKGFLKVESGSTSYVNLSSDGTITSFDSSSNESFLSGDSLTMRTSSIDTIFNHSATGSNKTITFPDKTGTAALNKAVTVDTTTSYAPVLADANEVITLNNGSAVTVIIPANASVAYPVGTQLTLINLGVGVVTVSVTSDTINQNVGGLTMAQYDKRVITKVSSTVWVLGY